MRLRAKGWSYVETLNSELEVWSRPGGPDLLLTPETDGSGDYSEVMIERIEAET